MRMIMSNTTYQPSVFFFLFLFSLALTGGSFVLQFFFHLEPCSLCMIARALVILLTCLFGIALLHHPQKIGTQIYRLLGGLLATFGVLIAARHIWLLHLPPSLTPDCIPNINYLLEILPLKEVLILVLKGSHECNQNNAYFLGLSLPAWTLGGFLVIVLVNAMPWRILEKIYDKKGSLTTS